MQIHNIQKTQWKEAAEYGSLIQQRPNLQQQNQNTTWIFIRYLFPRSQVMWTCNVMISIRSQINQKSNSEFDNPRKNLNHFTISLRSISIKKRLTPSNIESLLRDLRCLLYSSKISRQKSYQMTEIGFTNHPAVKSKYILNLFAFVSN